MDGGDVSFEIKVGLRWRSVLGSLLFMKVVDVVSWGRDAGRASELDDLVQVAEGTTEVR